MFSVRMQAADPHTGVRLQRRLQPRLRLFRRFASASRTADLVDSDLPSGSLMPRPKFERPMPFVFGTVLVQTWSKALAFVAAQIRWVYSSRCCEISVNLRLTKSNDALFCSLATPAAA